MRPSFVLSVGLLSAILLALTLPITTALAHENRDVGAYRLTVGFIVEPAFEGTKNGVDFRVAKAGNPVEDVEKTLKVDVTHVPSNTTKTMDLRTIFRDPGHYTNDFIPTAPGQYRFRFFGTIEGVQINETFTSGTGFSNMEPSADIQFPVRLIETRELQGATEGALSAANDADDKASSARTIGIVGIVIGASGLAVGGAALMSARKKKA